jgi:hypothetical protein
LRRPDRSIRIVVVNVCYTESQAARLLEIETRYCVIGVSGKSGQVEARVFALDFYRALAKGRSVGEAWIRGCVLLEEQSYSDRRRPQLRVRAGI